MFRLLADFNDIRHGTVAAIIENAEGPRLLRTNDYVLLHDGGEHQAWGTVLSIRDGLVYARIDWRTWGTG